MGAGALNALDGPELEVTLIDIDVDGAVGEAVEHLHGSSRAELLRKAALGSAAFFAALAAPPTASAGTVADDEILNFDLVFEYLQATFYTEADRLGTVRRMSNPLQVWARTLGAHERAHVAILKNVLGRAAVKSPAFDFHSITESPGKVLRTAVAMEDLTVALLLGQAARFGSPQLSAAIFSLLTVEARHAAWARRLAGKTPILTATDEPRTLAQVRQVVAQTHFVTSAPRLATSGRPPFTG